MNFTQALISKIQI